MPARKATQAKDGTETNVITKEVAMPDIADKETGKPDTIDNEITKPDTVENKEMDKHETSGDKEEHAVNEPKIEANKVQPDNKTVLTNDTPVALRSTVGKLNYVAQKGYPQMRWNKKGEVNYLTFGEVTEMRNQQPKFFELPWLIIEDEAVLDKFPEYRDLYAKYSTIESLEWLNSGDIETIKQKLGAVSPTMVPQLQKKVTELIMAGEIESVRVIKLLEEKLDTQLFDLIL